jgi:hypothetical protein
MSPLETIKVTKFASMRPTRVNVTTPEFMGDTGAEDLLAPPHKAGGLPSGQRPRFRVDQEVFLLNSNRENLVMDAHSLLPTLLQKPPVGTRV